MMAICIEMSSDAQKTSDEFRECRTGDEWVAHGRGLTTVMMPRETLGGEAPRVGGFIER